MEKKGQMKAGGNGPHSLKGNEKGVGIFEPEAINNERMQEQDGKSLRFSAGFP